MPDTSNPFYEAAKALWRKGNDGEDIARDLAQAFYAIVKEAGESPEDEFTRFIKGGNTWTS